MTQLISNVLMQPKSDAVERPLTLVEKLRNRRNEWASNPHYWMDSNLIGDVFNDVIDIVKQHEAESEVQEKIYQQEMDKINFCGCGCILAEGSTRCSDCEALDDM